MLVWPVIYNENKPDGRQARVCEYVFVWEQKRFFFLSHGGFIYKCSTPVYPSCLLLI